MGEKIKSILTVIGGFFLLALFGGVIAQGLELAFTLIKYGFYAIFWIAIILFVVNPSVYSSKDTEYSGVSFSFPYIWQTIKHFLIIQMIPGMLLLTLSILNKDLIDKENIGWYVMGPMFFGLGFIYLLTLFQKKNA